MNRILLAPGIACLLFVSSTHAQETGNEANGANASIAQNFQFINHPPAPPVQASAPAAAGSGRGHRHRQINTDAEQSQP